MVKSLPYLPTKASMSIKRRISLRPRQQCPLASLFFCSNNGRARLPTMAKTTGTASLPSVKSFFDSQPEHGATNTGLEPQYRPNKQKSSHEQSTCLTDKNQFIDIDDKALPYLPSVEASNANAFSSSKIYRLKPRPTSNHISLPVFLQ
jgi:hypothetical protein